MLTTDSHTTRQLDCIVLGAGLSGLAASHSLRKAGKRFVTLEKGTRPGGVIATTIQDGFVLEHGPNSLVATPEIIDLCTDLQITEQILHAQANSSIRQILWNNTLHTLKPSPLTLLKTKLLSLSGKIRLLKELFIKSKSQPGESVHDFFTRRLGNQAASRIAGAIINGIYAGDPRQLEMAAVFPRLIELENQYGSVIKGMMKSKGAPRTIINFKNGLQTLTDELATAVNESLILDTHICHIHRDVSTKLWQVTYTVNNTSFLVSAPHIISTIPSYALTQLMQQEAPAINIAYNPMLTFQVAIPAATFKEKTLGFGFLASPFERTDFIGVMLNGNIFETGLNEKEALMNFFVRPDQCKSNNPHTIFEELCKPLFATWTGITATPRLLSHHLWDKAIPQKTIGHSQWLVQIAQWEKANKGFHIAGNYRYGVALGDCVAHHQQLIEQIFVE